MRGRGYYVHTFGCRLNQFDSAMIAGRLHALGWSPVERFHDAAAVIVNSCTVTHRADAEARRFILRVKRHNPEAFVVLTGCYATREPELARRMPQIDLLVDNGGKDEVAEILERHARQEAVNHSYDADVLKARRLEYAPMENFEGQTRAFLKVQDGCGALCTYCIIPKVRGRSRSLPPEMVVEQARRFLAAGQKELVLTGVHLGSYGRDLGPDAMNLTGLVRRLLRLEGLKRLRLSSVEPMDVTDELMDLAASEIKIAPHFHVPLQSAADEILRRMGRPYRLHDYRRVVERIRRLVPDAAIGADVMTGFPSEGAVEFDETRAFLADSPLTYLHVFRYSPRPGTPAARMKPVDGEREAAERSDVLRLLSKRLNLRFRRSQEGKAREAVVLEGKQTNSCAALTDNYLEVAIPVKMSAGTWIRVKITEASASGTSGLPVYSGAPSPKWEKAMPERSVSAAPL